MLPLMLLVAGQCWLLLPSLDPDQDDYVILDDNKDRFEILMGSFGSYGSSTLLSIGQFGA